ncbi:hypothetical protein CKO45_26120 [Paracraurococcus ruber]|uniref:PEP-CTERM protein-sorting domain-containing protein n=2 Tax=Paracraurococcus ruber TaxID=77675 RepID=A0ABS1D5D3_9PROT|nr:hypothetical protein [Paracraurococcus ruber]
MRLCGMAGVLAVALLAGAQAAPAATVTVQARQEGWVLRGPLSAATGTLDISLTGTDRDGDTRISGPGGTGLASEISDFRITWTGPSPFTLDPSTVIDSFFSYLLKPRRGPFSEGLSARFTGAGQSGSFFGDAELSSLFGELLIGRDVYVTPYPGVPDVPIPAPGGLALFGLGLAGLAGAARRRAG